MTPKEKAQDLFDKIYSISGLTKESKQIALITVDEIIKSTNGMVDSILYTGAIYYWEEVKKEIELL